MNRIKFATSGIVRIERKLPKKFSTIDLKKGYVGEEIGEGWMKGTGKKVRYLTDAERDAHELFVRNGKLYDAKGNLYDTSNANTHWSGNGKSIFVMDENGRIFASKYQKARDFHHSSLSQGKPVAGAGEIRVKNGEIIEMSNQSGHYQPKNNNQTLTKLGSEGVDTNKIKIDDIKKKY